MLFRSGFYAEDQFNTNGVLTGSTSTPYIASSSTGFVPLTLSSSAYSNFVFRIDIGDIRGVNEKQLSNSTPLLHLYVGSDKEYQFFNQNTFTLAQDIIINLKKTLSDNTTAIRDGNHFTLNFARKINCNGFKVRVVEDYNAIGPTYNSIIDLDQAAFDFIEKAQLPYNSNGLILNCIYDSTSNYWIGSMANEFNDLLIESSIPSTNVPDSSTLLHSFTPSAALSGKLIINYDLEVTTPSAGGAANSKITLVVKQNATSVRTKSLTVVNDGASSNFSIVKTIDYAAGDVINLYGNDSSGTFTPIIIGVAIAQGSNLTKN